MNKVNKKKAPSSEKFNGIQNILKQTSLIN